MNQQLALSIQVNDDATFESFDWHDNPWLQVVLQDALSGRGEPYIYLWGQPGCGKSHLLQACTQALNPAQSSMYLPLRILQSWDPSIINELPLVDCFCMDDIDHIAQNQLMEEAIFHLYNRIRDQKNTVLMIAGQKPPQHIDIALPDLKSRLSSGLVIEVQELSDGHKMTALSHEAKRRGFELTESVAQFLVHRSPRNMHDLYALLDKLDQASLVAQRKITIPFIKSTLDW